MRVQHPNIVKYTGFVKTKEFLYIILEFVLGPNSPCLSQP